MGDFSGPVVALLVITAAVVFAWLIGRPERPHRNP